MFDGWFRTCGRNGTTVIVLYCIVLLAVLVIYTGTRRVTPHDRFIHITGSQKPTDHVEERTSYGDIRKRGWEQGITRNA